MSVYSVQVNTNSLQIWEKPQCTYENKAQWYFLSSSEKTVSSYPFCKCNPVCLIYWLILERTSNLSTVSHRLPNLPKHSFMTIVAWEFVWLKLRLNSNDVTGTIILPSLQQYLSIKIKDTKFTILSRIWKYLWQSKCIAVKAPLGLQ